VAFGIIRHRTSERDSVAELMLDCLRREIAKPLPPGSIELRQPVPG
jgi:hypothetical protein